MADNDGAKGSEYIVSCGVRGCHGVRKEYYLKVAFEDGAIETLHVSTATYNKARKDKPKVLTLQKGAFGLPVITKGL